MLCPAPMAPPPTWTYQVIPRVHYACGCYSIGRIMDPLLSGLLTKSKVGVESESAISAHPRLPGHSHSLLLCHPCLEGAGPSTQMFLSSETPLPLRSPLDALCDTVAPAPHLQLLQASLSQATRHPNSILHLPALSINRKVMAIPPSRATLASEAHNQPYSNG